MTTEERKTLSHLKYIIGLSLDSEELEEDYKVIERAIVKKSEAVNEMCLMCGKYKEEHLGRCNGCRWLKERNSKMRNVCLRFVCNPNKNIKCPKTNCYKRKQNSWEQYDDMDCNSTTHIEFAKNVKEDELKDICEEINIHNEKDKVKIGKHTFIVNYKEHSCCDDIDDNIFASEEGCI